MADRLFRVEINHGRRDPSRHDAESTASYRDVAAVLNGTGLSQAMWREYLSPVRSVREPWDPHPADTLIHYSLGWGILDDTSSRSISSRWS